MWERGAVAIPFTALSSHYMMEARLLYAKEFSFPSNNHDTQKGKMECEEGGKGNFPREASSPFLSNHVVALLF